MGIKYITLIAALVALIILPGRADASRVSILITSSLEGRFSPVITGQEKNDPLLLLAQNIIKERRGGELIYLDLGNAFHPGIVSRFSYGSAMMDFFTSFRCDAVLVSSKDLQTGIRNLEFLQKPAAAPLLSANIYRESRHVFTPVVIRKIGEVSIAFVGLSSESILFNIAEKNLYQVRIEEAEKSLGEVLPGLSASGVNHVVLVSGLSFDANAALLRRFADIDLVINGSDNGGRVSGYQVTRMDLPDGRAMVSAPYSSGYCLLELDLGQGITIGNISHKTTVFHETEDDAYRTFVNRLTRWKRYMNRELGMPMAVDRENAVELNRERMGALLRDIYNTELAVVNDDALSPGQIAGKASPMDVLSMVHDDYSIFIFSLTGADLKKFAAAAEGFYIDGYEKGKVQGYDINDTRMYRVSATQPVAESVGKILGRVVVSENTWKSMAEAVVDDLKKEKPVLYRDSFTYLDNRFRNTLDLMLSFFYENNSVQRGESIGTPPGKPEESYVKRGLESKIDWTIYNRYHLFQVTPYIYYVRHDDLFLNNLLRGTFFYRVNFDYWLRPYHKSQIDSLLFAVEDRRPTILRETLGADMEYGFLKGRFGFGFEKAIADPVEPVVYGLEGLFKAEYRFMNYFICGLGWDSFMALGEMARDQRYIRSELYGNFTVQLNRIFGFSFKYRWFYYYSFFREEKYSSSQFITSADLKTDFKIW